MIVIKRHLQPLRTSLKNSHEPSGPFSEFYERKKLDSKLSSKVDSKN